MALASDVLAFWEFVFRSAWRLVRAAYKLVLDNRSAPR